VDARRALLESIAQADLALKLGDGFREHAETATLNLRLQPFPFVLQFPIVRPSQEYDLGRSIQFVEFGYDRLIDAAQSVFIRLCASPEQAFRIAELYMTSRHRSCPATFV
jgi:hypothetical protein